MRQPTEERDLPDATAFVVASPTGSLIGALVRGLIEQRFPDAECSWESSPTAGHGAAKVTNVHNGHVLWVFATSPGRKELQALAAQAGTSAIELAAHRAEIESALKGLEDGSSVYSAALMQTLSSEGAPNLTRREREVAQLVAHGMSNAEIAAVLGLSPHTIRTHVSAICSRLGVTSRAKLAAKVRELEL